MKRSLVAHLPESIVTKVSDNIRENFVINGVVPLSVRDIDTRISGLKSAIITEIHDIMQQRPQTAIDSQEPAHE